jgi:hypothetical protein
MTRAHRTNASSDGPSLVCVQPPRIPVRVRAPVVGLHGPYYRYTAKRSDEHQNLPSSRNKLIVPQYFHVFIRDYRLDDMLVVTVVLAQPRGFALRSRALL